MKKIISFTALVFAGIMLTGTSAFAAPATTVSAAQNNPGDLLTLANTTAGASGPAMSFSPSPNNLMIVISNTNAYAIEAMNAAASDGDRNEYGIWYNMSGYYQNVNASTTSPPAFDITLKNGDELSSTPFGGWTAIGGGTS